MTVAAVYLRVSKSDDTDDETLTLATQRRRIAALCEARGWEYGPEYKDEGVSATKARDGKTEWARMLADVGTGRFDVIVARDLDRLLRTLQDLVKLIDLGAKVATVDGEIDLTSADGEFRATMLAAVARFEIRRKSERAIGANETRRRKGVPIMRGRILGYDEDGVTQIDDEADAVKKAFEDFLAGVKITHIARELTRLGFTTTRGREWSNENIRSLLSNARYKGVLTKWEPDPEKRKLSKKSPQEYPGAFEAIVSPDVFDAVQTKLHAPNRRRSWGTEARYLLTGLALCGRCDDGKTKVYTSYYQRAPGALKSGEWREYEPKRLYACIAHKHLSRNAGPVDEFVEDALLARLMEDDARDLFATPENRGIDRDALRIERVSKQDLLDGLAALYAEKVLDGDGVREQSARLRGRLNEIDGLLAPAPSNPGLQVVEAPDVAEAWRALDLPRRRLILAEVMTVTLLPSKRGAKGFDPKLVRIVLKGVQTSADTTG